MKLFKRFCSLVQNALEVLIEDLGRVLTNGQAKSPEVVARRCKSHEERRETVFIQPKAG